MIRPGGDGFEPLLTITSDDITAMGVRGEPQQGRITFKEFREKGVCQVPRSPDDNLGHVPFADFRRDPQGHPLGTPSGKFRSTHCQALTDFVRQCGSSEVRPIPAYTPATKGYEDTFANWEHKQKGLFPLQFYSVKYLRRAHSVYDNVPWLREAFPAGILYEPRRQKRGVSSTGTRYRWSAGMAQCSGGYA